MTPQVELVTNTWERTYREVLRPGWFAEIDSQNRFAFARRTALINNVDDRPHAETLARQLVQAGEIDRYAFVADHLERALRITGLTERDLARIPHYSDCPLVAVTLEGPPWLLYWDADVRLETPADWISPSLEQMEGDSRILAANPNWVDPTLERETIERRDDFALGHGFSDQVFLARRADLASPIYGQRCLAVVRSPLAHLGKIFETRIDLWMRHHDRLRATYVPVRYVHPPAQAGASYPQATPVERLRQIRNQLVFGALLRSPWRPRCCRYL
jgi:hypothetical protein